MPTIAVLRWIDESNAQTLGYDAADYPQGQWVIEDGAGEFVTDLDTVCEQTTMLREIDMDEAKGAARDYLSTRGAADSAEWIALPANYGTAYELHEPAPASSFEDDARYGAGWDEPPVRLA